MVREFVTGVASGAVGTATLNVATYLDMAVRARPSSSVPSKDVGKLADKLDVGLSADGSDDPAAANRRSALGALMGYVTGLTVGGIYGVIRSRTPSLPLILAGPALGAAAMAGSDVPSTLLGVTDPTKWSAKSWASDMVPHLAYGFATAAAYEAFKDH